MTVPKRQSSGQTFLSSVNISSNRSNRHIPPNMQAYSGSTKSSYHHIGFVSRLVACMMTSMSLFCLLVVYLLGKRNYGNGTASWLSSSKLSRSIGIGVDEAASSYSVADFQLCYPQPWDSYVCEGPEYDAFADKLEALLHVYTSQPRTSLSKPPMWGQRKESPFPANVTILAVGNSHTRQILQALACQYHDTMLQNADMESNTTNVFRRGSYYVFEFANHAKLHLVTNHALFYSRQWQRYLQEITKVPIAAVDAMIVGQTNRMADAYNTSFMELMIEQTTKLEDADFTSVDPPQVAEFAEFFPQRPMVAHSLMCYWGYDNFHNMNDIIGGLSEERQRYVRLVNARANVGLLGECSSNNWQSVGTCSVDPTGHRCVGKRGGHPDLIAWDIVEHVNELLSLSLSEYD